MNVITFAMAYNRVRIHQDEPMAMLHLRAFLFGRIRVAIFNAYGWP